MEYKDYYKTLGIDKTASQDEIKRAYRKQARKYHPDVSKESNAEEHFKEVGEAYEVLKDPEKRTAYDQLGANWKAGQEGFSPPPDWDAGFEFHGGGFTEGGGSSADFSDFFENLFGGGQQGNYQYRSTRGQGHPYQTRGEDSHARIFIDLEDAYQGASKSISLRSTILGDNGRPQLKERTLNIKIPKGIKQGQSIRLQGQGSPGIGGGAAGDLYLEIAFNPHSYYKVENKDVSVDVPIAPWEAALGNKIKVPTPTGMVDLKIPRGSSSGKKMRLKGRGIPAKDPGDFYVILEIVLPDQLSDDEISHYKALQKASGHFNPRARLGVA